MISESKDPRTAFELIVREKFSFLADQYGFSIRQIRRDIKKITIEYASRQVYVVLAYGHPFCEVDMSFGRIGIDDQLNAYSFGAGDLVLLDGCSEWKWESQYPSWLLGSISELSRLLRTCGSECLVFNSRVYELMENKRHEFITQSHKLETTKRVRADANNAWMRKDYSLASLLYDSIREDLTFSEKMRLEYSIKH